VQAMFKQPKTASWVARVLIAGASTLGLVAPPGCSSKGTPSLAPKPVKLARTQKVAVIRLGDPAIPEPPDGDIADGIRYAGLDDASLALVDRAAQGDCPVV